LRHQAVKFGQVGFMGAALCPQARRAELRIFGSHQALDGVHALFKAACQRVEFLQQPLVAAGQRGGGLPLGDVVEDDPRQADEQRADDQKRCEIHDGQPSPC
jgi:hypothetical protein